MKKISVLCLAVCCIFTLVLLPGCNDSQYGPADQIIIQAKDLPAFIGRDGVVVVDMQAPEDYAKEHVAGAINIPVSDILVNLPVENTLAPKGKVSKTLGEAGIDNTTQVVVYDEGGHINASRFWWTLLVYGHENVKVVSGVDAAIAHINAHGTRHSEAIVTANTEHGRRFQAGVDAAAVYINASTRFTDGGEFGLGAEVGISNQKLHARGPMGLKELTTYKYEVTGTGQTR